MSAALFIAAAFPQILKDTAATDLLNSVTVKLPLFWSDNIKMWLVQSESQFGLTGVFKSNQV